MPTARKLGDVEFLSLMLALILRGDKDQITATDRKRLEKYLNPGATTPNKHFMAVVALYIVLVTLPVPKYKPAKEARAAAIEQCWQALVQITNDEEHLGPTWREFRCPDPHQGMYELARGVLIWFGMSLPHHTAFFQLVERHIDMFAADLRVYDLVATHWGECHAMVGERCDNDPQRHAMTAAYREVRQRQDTGKDLRHRGYGGNPKALEKLAPLRTLDETNAIWYGPAWAWRLTIDNSKENADALCPLTGPLPPAILDMEVWHFDGGAMVTLADPGVENRHKYETHGSMAAKRSDDKDEDIASCVVVDYGKAPTDFALTVIHTWASPAPVIDPMWNPRLVARITATT